MSPLSHRIRADARAAGLTSLRRLAVSVLSLSPFWLVVGHRLAHELRLRRVPVVPLLLKVFGQLLWGAEIWPEATLGPGLVIAHSNGIVVGSAVVAGSDLLLFSGVVLGGSSRVRDGRFNHPHIGDRVTIYPHAVVAGGIVVGDDVTVSAGAIVLSDVPAGARVSGNPASVLP